MRLILVRHLWGTAGPWETLFPKIRDLGYTAIESALPAPADRDRFRRLLDQFHFQYIAQIFTAGSNVAEHLDSFRSQLAEAAAFSPFLVNSHSGRDTWSHQQSADFFQTALQVETRCAAAVVHETHRGRILFNSRDTVRLLQQFESLKLCCDFSHWVCVSERLLEDQLDAVALAATRCHHLHARVGYEQGPQVPDPAAPEYASHLAAHENWWRMVWTAQKARGDIQTTLTPEFGPSGYLHTLPHTNVPVADLWQVCEWQARRQSANFQQWQAAP